MSKKVVWLIASYLIVVMLVVASCGIAVVEEEEVVQEPPATETPAPTPPGPETVIFPDENLEAAEKEGTVTPAVTEVEVGKSRSNPVLFGQSLTYQNKRVTVLNSERLYQIEYNRADKGTVYLVVTVKVDFIGDPQEKEQYLSTLNYRVVGSKAVIYDEEWFTETETPLKGGEFYGGASTSGDLIYEVNESETSFVLIWNCAWGQDRYLEIP